MKPSLFFLFGALSCLVLSVLSYSYSVAPGAYKNTGTMSQSDICIIIGYQGGCSACMATKGLCLWTHTKDTYTQLVFGQCLSPSDFFSTYQDNINASFVCPSNPSNEPVYAMKLPFSRRIRGSSDVAVPSGESSQWFSSWHDSGLAAFPVNPWPVDRTSIRGSAGAFFTYRNDVELAALESTSCAALTEVGLFKASNFLYGNVANDHDRFCVKKFLDLYLMAFCPAYGVPLSGLCASAMAKLELNCNPQMTNVRLALYERVAIPFFDGDFNIVLDGTAYCIQEISDLATPRLLALAELNFNA